MFEFIDDPEKVAIYAVGVTNVRDVSRSDEGVGEKMTVTYLVLGMHFDEKFTYSEYQEPTNLVSIVLGP